MHSAFEHVAMLREKEKEKCLNLEQAITEIHKWIFTSGLYMEFYCSCHYFVADCQLEKLKYGLHCVEEELLIIKKKIAMLRRTFKNKGKSIFRP
jgi:hypothetical protein